MRLLLALARGGVQALVGLLLGLTLLHALLQLAPGDAIDLLPDAERLRPTLEAAWGLDRPWPGSLLRWLGELLRGDGGESLAVRPGAPVADLLLQAAPRSLGILLAALLLQLGLGLALALSPPRGPRAWAPSLLSAPPLFLLLLLLVHGINASTWALVEAGHIARPAWFALPDQGGLLRDGLAILGLALASSGLDEARAALEPRCRAILEGPHLLACRARGEPVLPRLLHRLLPELLDLGARRLPGLLGGLIIAEKLLLMQGAGSLFWQACLSRDLPLALGVSAGAAALVVGSRLAVDGLRLVLDPRLRGTA